MVPDFQIAWQQKFFFLKKLGIGNFAKQPSLYIEDK